MGAEIPFMEERQGHPLALREVHLVCHCSAFHFFLLLLLFHFNSVLLFFLIYIHRSKGQTDTTAPASVSLSSLDQSD